MAHYMKFYLTKGGSTALSSSIIYINNYCVIFHNVYNYRSIVFKKSHNVPFIII